MENSIHKMRAAHLILSATLTMQGENAPTFSAHCDTIDNLCETVMSVFEKLGYRDRTVLGMRLGFDPHKGFVPTKVCKYLEIATAFEMTLASSPAAFFTESAVGLPLPCWRRAMRLEPSERETIILFSDADDTASVHLDKKLKARLGSCIDVSRIKSIRITRDAWLFPLYRTEKLHLYPGAAYEVRASCRQ